MDALWPAAALIAASVLLGASVVALLVVARVPALRDEEAQFPVPAEPAGGAR